MSKPDDLPVWATDASYPAGSEAWSATPTKVEPSAGDQAAGWTPRQKPPAQTLNWWQHLVYIWLLWLDGLFVDFNGDDVDDLQMPTDGCIAVSGTGKYHHGTKTLVIPISDGMSPTAADNTWTMNPAVGRVAWTGGGTAWVLPIVLDTGRHITEIRFRSKCDAGTKITMEFYIVRDGGPILPADDDDSGTSVESAGSGAAEDTAMTGLDTTIKAGGYSYHLYFETVTGAGATELGAVEVDYDFLP